VACGIDTRIAQWEIDKNILDILDKKGGTEMPYTQQMGIPPDYYRYMQMQQAQYIPQATFATPKKENKKMLDNVKGYIEKHKDILFTLGLIILIDHFMFNGALRTRIQSSIEGVLKTVEDRFHKDTAIDVTPKKEA
jgi:hypothetical protein